MVSPRTSPVVVDRSSRSIRVSLRRGWEPGQIYHVTIRPQIQDLFNNRVTDPVHLVFSTGPAIPQTRLSGLELPETRLDAPHMANLAQVPQVFQVPADAAGHDATFAVDDDHSFHRRRAERGLSRSRNFISPSVVCLNVTLTSWHGVRTMKVQRARDPGTSQRLRSDGSRETCLLHFCLPLPHLYRSLLTRRWTARHAADARAWRRIPGWRSETPEKAALEMPMSTLAEDVPAAGWTGSGTSVAVQCAFLAVPRVKQSANPKCE